MNKFNIACDKRIIISPYPRRKRDGGITAKFYPYWDGLINILMSKGYSIIQIGTSGEEPLVLNTRFDLTLLEIKNLILLGDTWISTDSFLPHLVESYHLPRRGTVLWGKSDPKVYGYPSNLNILKSESNLKANQFHWWEEEPIDDSVWYTAEEVYNIMVKAKIIPD